MKKTKKGSTRICLERLLVGYCETVAKAVNGELLEHDASAYGLEFTWNLRLDRDGLNVDRSKHTSDIEPSPREIPLREVDQFPWRDTQRVRHQRRATSGSAHDDHILHDLLN